MTKGLGVPKESGQGKPCGRGDGAPVAQGTGCRARSVRPMPRRRGIAAWSDGSLDPVEAASVETHLSTCAHCQAVLAARSRGADGSGGCGVVEGGIRPLARPGGGAVRATVVWVAVRSRQPRPTSRPSRASPDVAAPAPSLQRVPDREAGGQSNSSARAATPARAVPLARAGNAGGVIPQRAGASSAKDKPSARAEPEATARRETPPAEQPTSAISALTEAASECAGRERKLKWRTIQRPLRRRLLGGSGPAGWDRRPTGNEMQDAIAAARRSRWSTSRRLPPSRALAQSAAAGGRAEPDAPDQVARVVPGRRRTIDGRWRELVARADGGGRHHHRRIRAVR